MNSARVSAFSSLDFIAKLAKIDTFIDRVRGIIGRVTTKINSVLDKVINKAVEFVRPLLNKLAGKPSSTTAVKPGSVKASTPQAVNGTTGKQPTKPGAQTTAPVQIPNGPIGAKLQVDGDKTPHHVWAEIQAGQPIIMMASTPMNIIDQLKGLKADAKAHLDPASNDFKTVDSSISKAGQHVGVGIAEIKTHLQTRKSKPNPAATSDTVKALDPKKITGAIEEVAKITLQNIRSDLQPTFPILAKSNGGVLPSVGLHPIPTGGLPRESHHVPAAELAEVIQSQYREVANQLSSNTTAPVKRLHDALIRQATAIDPVTSTRGNGLTAILIHKDTHRECKLGNAVHKTFLADSIHTQIQNDLQPGEKRVVMVITPKGKKERIEVNPQNGAWQAFLKGVYEISGVAGIASQGAGLMKVSANENALEEVAAHVTAMLKNAPASDAQRAVLSIKAKINKLTTDAFRHALGNGISAVRAALAHSTKDGDHAQHGAILGDLQTRAAGVWRSRVTSTIV
jgi:hypothetical protein